jgi:hypothetical protein
MAEGMCHVVVRYRSHFWVTPVFDRAGFLCRLPRGQPQHMAQRGCDRPWVLWGCQPRLECLAR